jgi:cytochrome b561
VIEKARERDPKDRYQTVAEFHAELGQIVAMQAAAEDAPWLRRFVAQGAQALKIGTERGWPWLLIAAVVFGFLLPAVPGSPAWLCQAARSVSVALFILLALTPLTGWFTLAVARRAHSAAIAAYGRAMGVLLALVNSVFFLGAFTFAPPVFNLGAADPLLYVEALLIDYVAHSLGIALLVYLSLVAAAALAHRVGRRYSTGFFIAFGIWLLGLGLVGIGLWVIAGQGWYAVLS